MSAPLLSMSHVVKDYQTIRPLRIESLSIEPGAIVALTGLDAQAAEVLAALVTGAVLPDAGDIQLFGKSTADVPDSDAWLKMLDGVGLVTERAVLLAHFTVEQNIAMPFTLQVDPVPDDVRPRIAALAAAVGLTAADLAQPVGRSAPAAVARVRLARALALGPSLLVAEHPTASLPREAVKPFAADLARVARDQSLAVLAITADTAFARALGGELLTHEGATGVLRKAGRWRSMFG